MKPTKDKGVRRIVPVLAGGGGRFRRRYRRGLAAFGYPRAEIRRLTLETDLSSFAELDFDYPDLHPV